MNATDSRGFEPRYFNFRDLKAPSDPGQLPPLSQFLEEFAFWDISGEVRPSTYSTINGVVLYAHLAEPEDYVKYIEEIGVELDPLIEFTAAIEERYSRLKSKLDEQSVPNAEVIAFIRTVENFAGQISTQTDGADIQSWCGVFFAMGLHAAHLRSNLSADLLAKWQTRQHAGETYLFSYVCSVCLGLDFMNEANPMGRFLGYCYWSTPRERDFMVNRILGEIKVTIEENKDSLSLAHIFMRAHDMAARIARDEPETLRALLYDIEQGCGTGTVQENLDWTNKLLNGPEAYPWAMTQVWDAGRELVDQQHPALIASLEGHAKRIAELSYFQRMVDFAVWSAFVGVSPNAFKNFNMENYSKLLESSPRETKLN